MVFEGSPLSKQGDNDELIMVTAQNKSRIAALMEISAMVAILLSYIWGWQRTFAGASLLVVRFSFVPRRGSSLRSGRMPAAMTGAMSFSSSGIASQRKRRKTGIPCMLLPWRMSRGHSLRTSARPPTPYWTIANSESGRRRRVSRSSRAYAVIVTDEGCVAVVEASKSRFFLPGGGLRSNEMPEAGLSREIVEECGWEAQVESFIGCATQFLFADGEGHIAIHARYFRARLLRQAERQGEHRLVWLSWQEAARVLARECDVWAISATLTALGGQT